MVFEPHYLLLLEKRCKQSQTLIVFFRFRSRAFWDLDGTTICFSHRKQIYVSFHEAFFSFFSDPEISQLCVDRDQLAADRLSLEGVVAAAVNVCRNILVSPSGSGMLL